MVWSPDSRQVIAPGNDGRVRIESPSYRFLRRDTDGQFECEELRLSITPVRCDAFWSV